MSDARRDFLVAKGINEAVIDAPGTDVNALSEALGFVGPTCEVVEYTTKAGKTSEYLSVKAPKGARNGYFIRLCEQGGKIPYKVLRETRDHIATTLEHMNALCEDFSDE